MQINSPDEMMNAIKLLIVQMNRGQRKQFLMWVKKTRNEFDFKYPEGYKIEAKETVNVPTETVAEPVIVAPPVEIIVPANHDPSSGIIKG